MEADFIKGIRSDLRASFAPYSRQRLTRTHARTHTHKRVRLWNPVLLHVFMNSSVCCRQAGNENINNVLLRGHILDGLFMRGQTRVECVCVLSYYCFFLCAWSALATGALSLVTPDGSPGSIMHQRPHGRLSLLSFVASPHQFPSAKVQQEKQR